VVLKIGKDGSDLKKYGDLTEAKKILVKQGARPNQPVDLAVNIALFCQKTGFDPEALVLIFGPYLRIANSDIDTYEDLKNKTRKLADSRNYFEQVERDLQAEYSSLFNRLNGPN
jgi:hypothetical protein